MLHRSSFPVIDRRDAIDFKWSVEPIVVGVPIHAIVEGSVYTDLLSLSLVSLSLLSFSLSSLEVERLGVYTYTQQASTSVVKAKP